MDLDRLTLKSQEALATAQRTACARNHNTIEPEHLLHALSSQPDGVVFRLLEALGATPAEGRMKEKVLEAVRGSFKPEFLNRVDEVVVFHRLTKEHILEIVGLMIAPMLERLLQRDVTLAVTDDAKRHLTDAGYDPTFGARPLRRLISKELSDGIALALLQGEYREGDTVRVDAPDGELVFERIPAKEKK